MPPVTTSNGCLSRLHVTAAKGQSKGFWLDTGCSSFHESSAVQLASAWHRSSHRAGPDVTPVITGMSLVSAHCACAQLPLLLLAVLSALPAAQPLKWRMYRSR